MDLDDIVMHLVFNEKLPLEQLKIIDAIQTAYPLTQALQDYLLEMKDADCS